MNSYDFKEYIIRRSIFSRLTLNICRNLETVVCYSGD